MDNNAHSHGRDKHFLDSVIDPDSGLPFSLQPGRQRTIGFCGTRGLPANYGGFETAVDEISRRFVQAGHVCDVFCRLSSHEQPTEDRCGRQLVYIRGSKTSVFDTFVSAIQTGWNLWRNRKRYDHVFWFNNANFPGILMTALAGIPMTVNTDGLEWRRAKWSWPFKLYYYLSSFIICRICRSVISDSQAIQDYYRRKFVKNTHFVPYGIPSNPQLSKHRQHRILDRFGLEDRKYFLQITRVEPDNLPLEVGLAFYRSRLAAQGFKMVFVGYRDNTPYAERLLALHGRWGVYVTEAVYDSEVLHALRRNCFCYVHGNTVGGTNPALVEAMATCPRILAVDCEFSSEVLGKAGETFDRNDITSSFERIVSAPDQTDLLRKRAEERYQWDAVAESYLRLSEKLDADYRPRHLKVDLPDDKMVLAGV